MIRQESLEASHREVRDGLGAAVLAAGPPPRPRLGAPWTLRPVGPTGDEIALVTHWMALPHVERFWQQAWPLDRWAAVVRGQLANEHSRPWLALRAGVPLVYLEIYRIPRDVVGRHYPTDPYDLGVHLAIGPEQETGRGVGRELVRAVVDGLFAADPRCRRVVADPDAGHVGARRMFTAAGFQLLGEYDLGHKRAALLSHPRPVPGAGAEN